MKLQIKFDLKSKTGHLRGCPKILYVPRQKSVFAFLYILMAHFFFKLIKKYI